MSESTHMDTATTVDKEALTSGRGSLLLKPGFCTTNVHVSPALCVVFIAAVVLLLLLLLSLTWFWRLFCVFHIFDPSYLWKNFFFHFILCNFMF